MRRLCVLLVGVFLTLSLPALATPALITGGDDALLADDYALVASNICLCDPVVSNPLEGITLISAAYYSASSESYLYMYQLINNSPSFATIHRLAVTNFEGLAVDTETGYIDANPDMFMVGTAAPLLSDISVIDETVGFYLEVLAGQISKVMYACSTLAPSAELAPALVQNSGQAYGLAVVPGLDGNPIPEPATMAMLGLGALLIGKRKK